MRHNIHKIILMIALCCTGFRAAAQAPSGFNYYTKAEVEATIGQDVYYYIQFFYGNMVTYLAEFQGDDTETANRLGTKDYFPFAKNIQWKLVEVEGEPGKFYLQSANGYYAYFNQTGPSIYDDGWYETSEDKMKATVFEIVNYNGAFRINMVEVNNAGFRRNGNADNPFTKEIHNWGTDNGWGQLRFARLKENAVHIIYRDLNYGNDAQNAVGNRLYLTYSGTNNNNYPVSARLSGASNNAAAWLLPSLADNHQEGLWELEQNGNNGEFYIKKYQGGDNDYLILENQAATDEECLLGAKNNNAIFKVDNNYANRYSRIASVNGGENVYLDYGANNAADKVGNPVFFWQNGGNQWYAGFAPVDPLTINNIDHSTIDKEIFYIRFSAANGDQNIFATDMGTGLQMQTKAGNEYSLERTWYINYQGEVADNKFTLQSGIGNYVYLDGNAYRTTADASQATTLGFWRMGNDGSYVICPYIDGKLETDKSMNCGGNADLNQNIGANGWSDGSKLEIISMTPQPQNEYTYRVRFRDLYDPTEPKGENDADDEKKYFTANDAGTKVTLEDYKGTAADYTKQQWKIEGESNQDFFLKAADDSYYADMVRNVNGAIDINTNLNRDNNSTQLFTTEVKDDATPFKLSYFESEWGTSNVEINLPDDKFYNYANEPGKMLAYVYENNVSNSRISRWDSEDKSRIMFIYDPLPLHYVEPDANTEYYYLRFVNETANQNVFVTDMGEGWTLVTNNDAEFENGRRWQIIYTIGDNKQQQVEANQFILKSGLGNYVYLDGRNFKTTPDRNKASTLCFQDIYDVNNLDGSSYVICDYNTYKNTDNKDNPRGCFSCDGVTALDKKVVERDRNNKECAIEIISVNPQPGNTYRVRFRKMDGKREYWACGSEYAHRAYKIKGTDNDRPIDRWYWTIDGSINDFKLKSKKFGHYLLFRNNSNSVANTDLDPDGTNPYYSYNESEAARFGMTASNRSRGTQVLKILNATHPTKGSIDANADIYVNRRPGNEGISWWNGGDSDEGNRIFFIYDPMAYVSDYYLRDRINHKLLHKMSYLKDKYYTGDYAKVDGSTGLAQNADSDWRIQDGTVHSGKQKTNEFKITHYIKRGELRQLTAPTTMYGDNRHIYYQRWYNYDTENIEGLFDHAYFDLTNHGRLRGYVYDKGLVTGQEIYWPEYFDEPVYTLKDKAVYGYFYYTNPDGKDFTVAADVSRYSDYHYKNISEYLNGDLEEPTIGLRYIYTFKDAKEMAAKLTECTEASGKWLETRYYHFPQTRLAYEEDKTTYPHDYIPVDYEFNDYWVFNDGINDDDHLRNQQYQNCGIEVNLAENTPGLQNVRKEGTSRYIHFKYPDSGTVDNNKCGDENAAVIKVTFNDNGTIYQIAKINIVFDQGTQTLPWSEVKNKEDRNPKKIRETQGEPIAKITFDYPEGAKYSTPDEYSAPGSGNTLHVSGRIIAPGTVNDATSPLPLKFDNTNYGYAHDGAEWGNYTIVNTMFTRWGLQNIMLPANDETRGSGTSVEDGMQRGFMYIDASELPGNICNIPFQGSFCPEDKLTCTGWISGSNRLGDNKCPGSVILTVKGRKNGVTDALYRYCPGQVMEIPAGDTETYNGDYRFDAKNNPNGYKYNGDGTISTGNKPQFSQWQQFCFTFSINKFYDEYWLEVTNNCVNTYGGDFMLDDIEIYATVPEIEPELNTPKCVEGDNTVMKLLKMDVSYAKLKAVGSSNPYLNVAFLERDEFLKEFRNQVSALADSTLEAIEQHLLSGDYESADYTTAYKKAFDKALLGEQGLWKSDNPNVGKGNGLLTYVWDNDNFENMTLFDFADAVAKNHAVYRYVDEATEEKRIVINGNYSGLPWKENTQYYIVTNVGTNITVGERHTAFNITSPCTRVRKFTLNPAYKILGIDGNAVNEDEYEVCDGKTISITTNLSGYNINGEVKQLEGLNYDWWLGDIVRDSNGFDADASTIPTLENFYAYKRVINGTDVYLSEALSHYRQDHTDISPVSGADLDVIYGKTVAGNKHLTTNEKELLKQLINEGQLVMGRRSLDTEAFQQSRIDEKDNIWAFYLLACPINDETLQGYLSPENTANTVYACDQPQELKIMLDGKSPSLNSGFVANANGYDGQYNYRQNIATLSVRMANKEQFETLRHSPDKEITLESRSAEDHLLFLPVRNASVGSDGATGIIKKPGDENVYLSSTTDPDWDREIQKNITKAGVPPVVGKIVELNAIDTGKSGSDVSDASNRLVVYFYDTNKNGVRRFDVREGYNYTLSVPYQENDGVNTCDGSLLINLKIVPDYEVWTGGADNTDWSNDENWRRADYDELYAGMGKLADYQKNRNNYRYGIDQALRKGFAPLYCTHVLMMNKEWGNAPELYDALDYDSQGKAILINAPFPNLRDLPGWDGTTGDSATPATASEIIKFDMQVRSQEKWPEIYGEGTKSTLALTDNIYDGDLFAEMYQTNTCDEIAFQPGTELLNAHLLNYNTAWVEHELDLGRWYLMGSSLQGTIAGEWYAPSGGTTHAKQQTSYFEPVTFGAGYDRFSPAYFQRGWDKAKTVLYQVGATYNITNDPDETQTGNFNNIDNTTNDDEYLSRIGYRLLGDKKANVAIKGTWGNTYNDVTVDYSTGGFTMRALYSLRKPKDNNDDATTVVRLPKEDTMYDYYKYDQTGAADGGTDTYISNIQTSLDRAKNRGRLKTDQLLPKDGSFSYMWREVENANYDLRQISRVPTTEIGVTGMINAMNDTTKPIAITEELPAGESNLGFYLVGNPFQTGLDMDKFFEGNTALEKKFWIMTADGQMVTVRDVLTENWITQKGEGDSKTFEATNAVVAPGQGFFVQAKTGFDRNVKFTRNMQARTRTGMVDGTGKKYTIVVGTQQKQAYEDGKPLFDNGVAAYEDGELVKDQYGNVMVHPYVDGTTSGEVDNDADLIIGVPTGEYEEVDGKTTPVMEDIEQEVTIYEHVKATDQPNYTLRARKRQVPTPSAQFTITAKSGTQQSSALLTLSEQSSNEFMPAEDTELFMADELATAPYVYTLCGHLATVVNRLHDFRCIPIGLENAQPGQQTTLRFNGVEALGDGVTIYDAQNEETIELQEGTELTVNGNTLGRYFLVRGGSISEESIEPAKEISITHKGSQVTVTSTADDLRNVRAYSTDGKLLHSANPGTPDYTFTLPSASGLVIIEASTAESSKTKKILIH